MRRPTLRTTAGMLAMGAIGLAAPTAATIVGAAVQHNVVTVASQTPNDTTAPSTGPTTQALPVPRTGPPIGTIDPAEQKAFEDCMTAHGATAPKFQLQPPPPPPPAQSGSAGAIATQAAPPGVPMPPTPPALDDKTKAALDACKDKAPKIKLTAAETAKIREFEACMKANGVDLPPFDPNTRPGSVVAPKAPADPAVMQKAQEACKDKSPFPVAGASGGPGGGCMIAGAPGGPGGPVGPGAPSQQVQIQPAK